MHPLMMMNYLNILYGLEVLEKNRNKEEHKDIKKEVRQLRLVPEFLPGDLPRNRSPKIGGVHATRHQPPMPKRSRVIKK